MISYQSDIEAQSYSKNSMGGGGGGQGLIGFKGDS